MKQNKSIIPQIVRDLEQRNEHLRVTSGREKTPVARIKLHRLRLSAMHRLDRLGIDYMINNEGKVEVRGIR